MTERPPTWVRASPQRTDRSRRALGVDQPEHRYETLHADDLGPDAVALEPAQQPVLVDRVGVGRQREKEPLGICEPCPPTVRRLDDLTPERHLPDDEATPANEDPPLQLRRDQRPAERRRCRTRSLRTARRGAHPTSATAPAARLRSAPRTARTSASSPCGTGCAARPRRDRRRRAIPAKRQSARRSRERRSHARALDHRLRPPRDVRESGLPPWHRAQGGLDDVGADCFADIHGLLLRLGVVGGWLGGGGRRLTFRG